jgi:cell division septum initiation protein DivIVA
MSERKFLNWVGFKGEPSNNSTPGNNLTAVERIRELESQIADLKSRRDITSLTREEFEILATETTTSLIKAAQDRERKAISFAEKLINEGSKKAADMIAQAQEKADQVLGAAELRARKFISSGESQVKTMISAAQAESESIVNTAKHQADAVRTTAEREAENIVSQAHAEVASYRKWLTTAITEADRLYQVQNQSLKAAERAIQETRAKLNHTFERLASLQNDIEENLDENNKPVNTKFLANKSQEVSGENVVSIKSESTAKRVKKTAPSARSVRK